MRALYFQANGNEFDNFPYLRIKYQKRKLQKNFFFKKLLNCYSLTRWLSGWLDARYNCVFGSWIKAAYATLRQWIFFKIRSIDSVFFSLSPVWSNKFKINYFSSKQDLISQKMNLKSFKMWTTVNCERLRNNKGEFESTIMFRKTWCIYILYSNYDMS